jgi:hypothetical protein
VVATEDPVAVSVEWPPLSILSCPCALKSLRRDLVELGLSLGDSCQANVCTENALVNANTFGSDDGAV